ncbi:MAG TPA: dTDP-4-dehydrorhamnose 3,5-epimerase family protein, partial [Gemmatimonadaceae bacterium]
LTLSPVAELVYKTTDFYFPRGERVLRWDDPTVKIAWPSEPRPILAPKDAAGVALADADTYP